MRKSTFKSCSKLLAERIKTLNLKRLFKYFIILSLLCFLFAAKQVRAQETFFNYSIDKIVVNVNVRNDLSTQNEIIIEQTSGLTDLSWPLPENATKIKTYADGFEQKYDLISRGKNTFIIFNAGINNHIIYEHRIPPEQKNNIWEIFLPILSEPRLYLPDFKFNLSLPQGAKFIEAKIYAIHSFENSIISEKIDNNRFESQLKIEPTSIISFQGKSDYHFRVSFFNQVVNFINQHFLILSLGLIFFIIIITSIFIYAYVVGFGTGPKLTPPTTFLEKSYIYFKKIIPESIAATILDWAEKGLVNIIEKEDGSFILGKVITNPNLPAIEQHLWSYLFEHGNLKINLNKIEEQAEETIIPKEILDLENLTIEKLKTEGFIRDNQILDKFGLNNLLLILAFIILITLTIAAWLININWLILPGIAFIFAVITIGNYIPTVINLTRRGVNAREQLQEWKKKLSAQITTNLSSDTLNHNLAFMVFFSLEEKISAFSQTLPISNYPFLISYNPNELPSEKIKKILKFVFWLSKNLNRLKQL